MVDFIVNELRHKRILILGFGREGKSSLKFITEKLMDAETGIADQQPIDLAGIKLHHSQKLHLHTGPDYLKAIPNYDLVLKSPGISLRGIPTGKARISSQTDLFLAYFAHQVIGISGTKGKSTTSSLIHHILSSAGFDSILTGNIGIPCFDIMHRITDESLVVFELSANQLENVRHSPHIAVLLNIFEEHLDHFGSYEAYRQAKYNLMRYCQPGDTMICHRDVWPNDDSCKANHLLFPSEPAIAAMPPLSLPGQHNSLNVEAALLAVGVAGVSPDEARRHLQSFKGLPHRIELVGTFGGVTFYNDSIATIPEAAIAAIRTIEKVDFLILGGFDRGIAYQSLIDFLSANPVPHILFTGEAGKRISEGLHLAGTNSSMHFFDSLGEAMKIVNRLAKDGNTCLLSPAAASYDQYKNFEQRGDLFKQLARSFRNL